MENEKLLNLLEENNCNFPYKEEYLEERYISTSIISSNIIRKFSLLRA
jgi:hypothetical protein